MKHAENLLHLTMKFVTTTPLYQFYVVELQAASGTTPVQLQDLDIDCLDACKNRRLSRGLDNPNISGVPGRTATFRASRKGI
jgi:hypothetical protein